MKINPLSWYTFQDSVKNLMDSDLYFKLANLIEKCQSFENYLRLEIKTNEKETLFSSHNHIAEFLNKTIKVI